MSTDSTVRYDFVIFGATGFTGQFVVEEVARIAEEENLTWAIAGRKMDKLQKVLSDASKKTGKELEDKPIIIADVSSDQSLIEMCQQAKTVINCVGPYRFYGEQVVKASIEAKCNHIDISGEPQFLEKVQLLYHGKAQEEGIYIIGSCGFDSIPADMGVIYTRNNFPGDLNSIESYLDIKTGPAGAGINFATFESAVNGFAYAGELMSLRKSLFPSPLPKSQHKLAKRSAVFKSEEIDKWCVPFPGSDRSVVNRTQRFNYDQNKTRPIQFVPYFACPSTFSMILTVIFGIFFGLFAKIMPSILLKFPSLFTGGLVTKGGPSKKQIEETSFSMTFYGQGYDSKIADVEVQHENAPSKKIVTKVVGPEPGYVSTPICLVQAAVVLNKEKSKLPSTGGVYTPGAAFQNTSLIDRLDKHNVKFSLVQTD
ncbi:hypothetical protein LOTGIDRAFT_222130 [Lottia gigantea]|uniref:Saccharopine dehydrogenase NADP binding domain-containing protein n=1 Tax=Lottia gigantea TaxID=225164 RepID=V4B7C8_LOTGI|nr:hypothetical protein LOTGIDRAFT_222130 [Lottia gigantea]ESO84484.1 hypothetical protein LOTGIDRAFT_222130 [Lottia gigantea]